MVCGRRVLERGDLDARDWNSGVLSASSFTEIATCDPNAADCSTTALVFTLGPKSTVQRSGNHTLVVTWKVESIGS